MFRYDVVNPYQFFTDLDGSALEDGYVYLGTSNLNPETNPIQVFWDEALTIPAAQPLRTSQGYPVRNGTPSRVFVAQSEYSITVRNKNRAIVITEMLVTQDALRADIENITDPSLGAGMVGRGGQVVNSIAALRLLLKTSISKSAFVTSYYGDHAGGGGEYSLDATDVSSADNGGTIIVAADGGRWKLSYNGRVDVKQFGAKGNNVQNDQPFIQAALDAVKAIYLPAGIYKVDSSIELKANGYSIIGENMNNTVLASTGTHSIIKNPDSSTTTRLFCEIKELKIAALSIGANIVLDWKSCQFGTIHRVWILGQNTAGCFGIQMLANWTVTECTYNVISECYIGICAAGITFGDGANNNTVRESRIQPSFAGGVAISFAATAAGRISSNSVINNGFEYPGNVSNGVNVLQNCDGIRIQGNRFESLNNAIIIGATGNTNITAGLIDNYFSSNATNINISTGCKSAAPTMFASAATITSGAVLAELGFPFNITPTRTGVGAYTFTFIRQPASTGYSVSVGCSTHQYLITAKTTAAFTIQTNNGSGVATDAALLDVTVLTNR